MYVIVFFYDCQVRNVLMLRQQPVTVYRGNTAQWAPPTAMHVRTDGTQLLSNPRHVRSVPPGPNVPTKTRHQHSVVQESTPGKQMQFKHCH